MFDPAAADAPRARYDAALAGALEAKWQAWWDEDRTWEVPNPSGPLSEGWKAVAGRPKAYVLDMFPYPSGSGLHVGHPLGYIGTDVYGRFLRMTGRNVIHTIGYDAFGLPAEQYAVETGQHPRVTTEANIANMRRQLKRLGLAHDHRRAVATTDVAYVRWTQWIFLQIYNSWYDADAQRARPIAELEEALAQDPAWADLTEAEHRRRVDEHRLAYRANAMVNWCPGLGTVLANEEVTADGRSDRGNFPVYRRPLTQWMLRITAYADRLVADLDGLDWPEPVKLMQRNWIGRSTGATVRFPSAVEPAGSGGTTEPAGSGGTTHIEVFTTRPDTLFGATFMVLAPEHPLVDDLVPAAWPEGTREAWTGGHASPADAVAAYRKAADRVPDQDRLSEARPKTGVFTGGWARNPVNERSIPVFVADYVLMGYGTGAIMAVPAQDERDWAFAEAYDLDIVRTVQPPEGWEGDAYLGDGPAINSSGPRLSLDGMGVDEAKAHITSWLEAEGLGRGAVTYKLRDWLFSRQRYWGEPFPIVYDEAGQAVALPASHLPVELPELDDFAPRSRPDDDTSDPEPPLGRASDWVHVELDLGDGPRRYRRELNTMPQWAGSCWYYLRYLDPTNDQRFVDRDVERYWMGSGGTPGGVDLYVGGVEHAVLHLLYSRFWHKVLFDLGEVSTPEPFQRLFNQGMIGAAAYLDERGVYVPAAEVTEEPDGTFSRAGRPVRREMGKMGKSLKNAVTPDEIYEEYGGDTLRVYEMSMGPLDMGRPWNTRDIVGAHRLLQRAWRAVVDEETGEPRVHDEPVDPATAKVLARVVDGVAGDYAGLRFNTAVAKIHELVNHVTKAGTCPRPVAEALALLLAPLAPHLGEELWALLGHQPSVGRQPFPVADPALLVDDTVTLVVQVNGKVRDRVEVATTITAEEAEAVALASAKVVELLAGGTPKKVVARPPTLVNVVL
jgi:leucyl-tRNA synthetase